MGWALTDAEGSDGQAARQVRYREKQAQRIRGGPDFAPRATGLRRSALRQVSHLAELAALSSTNDDRVMRKMEACAAVARAWCRYEMGQRRCREVC